MFNNFAQNGQEDGDPTSLKVAACLESSILLHAALWSDESTEPTRIFETYFLYVTPSAWAASTFSLAWPVPTFSHLPYLYSSRFTVVFATAVPYRYLYQHPQCSIDFHSFQIFFPYSIP